MKTAPSLAATDTSEFLSRIKIASPCSARWEDMAGDERSRFCAQCSKHVYNFSAMTGTEVMALIREKEGRLCGRYYRRNDGTMLTADCPVGLASRASRRMKSLAFAGMLTVMGALGATTYAGAVTSRRQESQHPSRIAIELDRMVWRMKVWLGFRQPVAVAGGICAPPVKAVTTVAPVSAPK